MIATSLFRRGSEHHAEHAALLTDRGWLTHHELAERADRIAGGLRELGVGTGERVVLALPNSPELLMVELALLRNGLVRVALGGRLRWSEIAVIAQDCEASAIIVEDASVYADHIEASVRPTGLLITIDPHPSAHATVAGLAAGGRPPPAVTPGPDELAMLMYSSGSTGEPKAAIVTQRTWASCVSEMAAHLPLPSPQDVLIQSAPMSHFGGSVGLVYAAHGAATVVLPRFEPMGVLQAIRTQHGTALPLAPTMLRRLTDTLQELDPDSRPTGTLRSVPYGGSAISATELARSVEIFGESLVQFYGLAEALTPITVLDGPTHVRAADGGPELSSAGRPAEDTEVRIGGSDETSLLHGEIGQILVRGPRVMPAYWRRQQSTAEVLSDGWFATGDLGYRHAGLLYLVDRSKDVIVSGGYNVYPSEVERVIASLPDVQEVAVVSVPDERWGEGVGAVVATAQDADLTADDVVDACRQQLASYKKPVYVQFLTALPTNAAGKIDKKLLRDRFWRSHTRRIGG